MVFSFTNAAKTYGRMFILTHTDIINDHLGAGLRFSSTVISFRQL